MGGCRRACASRRCPRRASLRSGSRRRSSRPRRPPDRPFSHQICGTAALVGQHRGLGLRDDLPAHRRHGGARSTATGGQLRDRATNHIRNVAAHHSRLWNRSPADQPIPPKPSEFALLDPLAADRFAQSRLYAVAAVMQYLLRIIDKGAADGWSSRLKAHFATFPAIPTFAAGQSGFPTGWEAADMWN